MKDFWKRFSQNRGAVVGLVILLLVVIVSIVAPFLYTKSPWAMVQRPFIPPFTMDAFFLGTDPMGRDLAAGLAYGARVSLLVGLVSTVVSLLIGIPIGAIAGYFGGWVDDVLMRFTEFFQSVPSFALAVVLVAIFQPSIYSIVISIAIVSWPPVARLLRGEVMSLRSREFVEAAVLSGQRHSTIIWRQILPNTLSPIIVLASMMVAAAILIESSLSFLGLGDRNIMSWGYIIGAGRTVIRQAWWVSFFPGLAILLTVLALNLVGEGLNDALNPRLARKGK
ncbi:MULTISPECIES: ABC transporter permease [Agrobacterium]|jgi:peptide/nickel transport system permease protein|uniref:ABC transporter permease n=1 Tax=Agrobacterium cavarae TaxID=2528239 RepID=A0ABY1YB48_9HYPH|nr:MULTISPECIES: ABC transporter permease [Agrobacterium]KQR30043.1 ABC transporter permease [Rhizobium sp. Leaf155]MDP9572045.1 peptide/nickel transport system permease protein [Agrobacterium larrymoorei]MQB19156.1 ABC transporter permease [Agrobacterium tumefaciens]MDD1497505.1 ABC transporter permease [Agrobacterium sp. CNPSo 3708]TBN14014.1 ABC transporter permease [Agrobacterium cavarae]